MYTFHKQHLTWQQSIGHEVRDRLNYKSSNDEKYYDLDRTDRYLQKMEDIKMKRFYGKHLDKYTGDTQPQCTLNETGIGNRFAPLHKTGFGNTGSGWRKSGSVQPGTLRSMKVDSERSANMENVEKFRATNEGLQGQLNQLNNKLTNPGQGSNSETEKIFQKIAQKTLNRNDMVKLQYSEAQADRLKLTIKQAEPGKVRMILAANTIDDVPLSKNAQADLQTIKDKIQSERRKRQEVERELRGVLQANTGAYRPDEIQILGSGSKEFNLRSSNL